LENRTEKEDAEDPVQGLPGQKRASLGGRSVRDDELSRIPGRLGEGKGGADPFRRQGWFGHTVPASGKRAADLGFRLAPMKKK
jgi:hypothetical protein